LTQQAEHITIDDFTKVELRVAQILVAERIPKADKLLRLEVDLGYEKRQILAGIAQFYEPEKLVGRKIVIVANLAPRKMRGLESNGMLLAASLPDGAPVLAGFLEGPRVGRGYSLLFRSSKRMLRRIERNREVIRCESPLTLTTNCCNRPSWPAGQPRRKLLSRQRCA
jgi:methionine--tRNA ligase beta chain